MGSLGKSAMGSEEVKGQGTRVAEYIETPLRIHCATCEYLTGKNLCRNKIVAKDKEVKTDKKTGLKIIDPVKGCCRMWEAEDNDEDDE